MKKFRLYFWLSVICVWVETIALLSVPFLNHIQSQNTNQLISYVVAGIFWLGMIMEQIFLWSANAQRKRLNNSSEFPIGLISFWKTTNGKIADIILIISILLIVILNLLKVSTGWIVLFSILILFLSIQLHCFYNGRNYQVLINYKERKEENR